IFGTAVSLAEPANPPHPTGLPAVKVQEQAPAKIGGKPSDPCVSVDIAGRRAGAADCAARKLQDAAKAAQEKAQGQKTPDIPTATSPDTKIGVANDAATRQRLGDSFGKSVVPQRPTRVAPAH